MVEKNFGTFTLYRTINVVDDKNKLSSIKENLEADFNEQAWIWVAPNQHDVCGYYWLISQLKEL